jgi:hypothetical protein
MTPETIALLRRGWRAEDWCVFDAIGAEPDPIVALATALCQTAEVKP